MDDHEIRGLLADVNVQGHLAYRVRLFRVLDLEFLLTPLNIRFVTFADLGLPLGLDDRSLWHRCQQDHWVLFTENRNNDGPDSLHATLQDAWHEGHLPVLTLSNKRRFDHSRRYAERVAVDIAELLFGIASGEYRNQPRIYVPFSA